jgi:hypothetical protein
VNIGYYKDAALDMEGVKNVLKLRAKFAGGAAAGPRPVHRSFLLSGSQGAKLTDVEIVSDKKGNFVSQSHNNEDEMEHAVARRSRNATKNDK